MGSTSKSLLFSGRLLTSDTGSPLSLHFACDHDPCELIAGLLTPYMHQMRAHHRFYATSNQEPLFPATLTSCSKQATDGETLGTVADLVQWCLLGSNCVLTWRETEYYSHAGKQITVTSLADKRLYLFHDQMEFEENKLAFDAAWPGSTDVCCLWGCV